MPSDVPPTLQEKDLKQWRLIERFQTALAAEVAERGGPSGTWAEPQRQLALEEYLSLFLFGLFNPVVETMRGLCGASQLARVQREVCGRPVSLGSFSEAQAVVEPELLKAVCERLANEAAAVPAPRGARWPERPRVVDSTVWRVLPRMTWAFWRRQGGVEDNAVRLHVELDGTTGQVSAAELTRAKVCERKMWGKFARPGICDTGDCYYSYDYQLLARLQAQGTDFVVRLRLDTQWVEETCELLTATDRAAGVTWAGTVRLGKEGVRTARARHPAAREGREYPDCHYRSRRGSPAGAHRGVLPAPLAGGDVFPVVEVHPGLPALAGGERPGRGAAGVSGADCCAVAVALPRRAA